MRLQRRFIGWIALLVLVVVVLGGSGGYLWLRRSLP